MSIASQIESQLAEHGVDVARSLLRHLPEIVAWLKHRHFDPALVTADFERLSRTAKAEYDAGRARLVDEAARQARADEPTVTRPVIRDAGNGE